MPPDNVHALCAFGITSNLLHYLMYSFLLHVSPITYGFVLYLLPEDYHT